MRQLSLNLNYCRRARPVLGTLVDVAVHDPRAGVAERALGSAFAAVERVQSLMSFHEPGSDISRINRDAHRFEVPIHPWTRRVLRRALLLSELSDGAFDVTGGATLVRFGYLPGAPADDEGASWRDVELRPGGVRLHRRLQVDLGGIAKGFAVDVAVAAATRLGVRQVVVDAGGDVRVESWEPVTLGIRDPGTPSRVAATVALRRGALATSAAYRSRARRGRWVSHLVDPRTRRPYLGRASVSVMAPTCMEADALTKVVILGGGGELLRRRRAEALVLLPGGRRAAFAPERR